MANRNAKPNENAKESSLAPQIAGLTKIATLPAAYTAQPNAGEEAKASPLATQIAGPTKIATPPFAFPAPPSAEEEWARFSADLALVLAELDEDEFLIISRKRTDLYVQLAAQGRFGMRAEAVSNNYLKEKIH